MGKTNKTINIPAEGSAEIQERLTAVSELAGKRKTKVARDAVKIGLNIIESEILSKDIYNG